ncbi:Cof-type HAD-IIB family hydrolase [Acetilactobacillus jinshanensis]|uniref:Cof-type HAD-IIB family hydrolase n=1 Tax=Acetilactobacillus jinshanensis TaxID=1720083 RepID=UPI0013A5FC6D|nr:Cof-type HAD-IIB family hydrolase [Acetilactobacillus jinshanensis]URL61345.1 Cof-type HAD-IIB family hydrolase [uncultured bacterium]
MNQLRKNNVLPVISTGRNTSMIKSIIKVTGIQTLICNNGGYLQYQGKPLNTIAIPTPVLENLVNMASKYHNALDFQDPYQIVLSQANALTTDFYAHRITLNPPVNKKFYQSHPIVFVHVFTHKEDGHDLDYINHFKGQLHILRNNPYTLDVTKVGVSKKLGIQILLKKLHLQNIPTYAFGDGANDIEMLDQVDYGIAMGNGVKACKDNASFVTDTDDRDGIAKGLKHYHLI